MSPSRGLPPPGRDASRLAAEAAGPGPSARWRPSRQDGTGRPVLGAGSHRDESESLTSCPHYKDSETAGHWQGSSRYSGDSSTVTQYRPSLKPAATGSLRASGHSASEQCEQPETRSTQARGPCDAPTAAVGASHGLSTRTT